MVKGSLFVVTLVLAGCSGDTPGSPDRMGCNAVYPDQATSRYVLPFEVGRSFTVGQGNCSEGSHAEGTDVQFAYDFLMPIGTPVVAARAGTVLLVEESYTDANRTAGMENYINVLHDDGTIAGYVHLTRDGVLVEVGQRIAQGEIIGHSGDTGSSSEAHLHFHIQECDGCGTVPVTFRNTRPHPQGLVVAEAYVAGPH
jgi:murein DD-endopeptidase MepM/ murein hydrolase activator NlpD